MLDLTKGYWHVMIAVKDRRKTAVATPFCLYQFRHMLFGLQGAPVTFQHMMDALLDGFRDFSRAYLDDLVRYISCTWKQFLSD